MTDTTIGKLITSEIKLVAFKRVIPATEWTTELVIFRLTDFSWGQPEEWDFTNEEELVEAFMSKISNLFKYSKKVA